MRLLEPSDVDQTTTRLATASLYSRTDLGVAMSFPKPPRVVKKATRVMWTQDEDKKLILIVKQNGVNAETWKKAADRLIGRNVKQCRERWCNQLDPNVKKGQWTPEEEELIVQLQRHIGNKWSQIASTLTGRTDNSVKNHWHGTLKQKVANQPDIGNVCKYHSPAKILAMVEEFSADKGSVTAKNGRRCKKKGASQPLGSSSTARSTPKKNAVKRTKKNITEVKGKVSHSSISRIKGRQQVKSLSTLSKSHAKRKQSRTNNVESANRVNTKKRKQSSSRNSNSRRPTNKNSTPLSVSKKRRRNTSTKDKTGARSIEDDGAMMSQIFMASDGLYGEAGTKRGKSLLSISPQMPASKTISLSPPMINESPLFNDFQYVGETMGVENGTIFLPIENGSELYRTPTPGLTDFSIKSSTPIRGVDSWDNVGKLFNDQKMIAHSQT